MTAQLVEATVFEAASRDRSIVVQVGTGGECLGVALTDDAMRLPAARLESAIMLLSTLGRLRAQHAIGVTSDAEVGMFAALLEGCRL